MSQSRDQLPIANSRFELAAACQLKVVITLRFIIYQLKLMIRFMKNNTQQTTSLGRRLHAR